MKDATSTILESTSRIKFKEQGNMQFKNYVKGEIFLGMLEMWSHVPTIRDNYTK
jgi:hypothetical protein